MPMQRTLLDDGKPLRLGSRALDILVTLVEKIAAHGSKPRVILRIAVPT